MLISKKITFALLTLVIAQSAQSTVIRHDVDNQKYHAKIEDFPPLAILCSIGVHGTLIDPEWVVTAGHTVFCLEPGDKIRVGYHWAEI